MSIRPLSRIDAGPLLELWNASARFDPLTPALLEEKVWGDPGFCSESVLLHEVDGCIDGFVMGVLRQTADGPRGIIKLIVTNPDQRRRGIGSRLLQAVEQVLTGQGARSLRICESPPNYLTPGVDTRYSSAHCFFESHGYQRCGEACNMTVDLGRGKFSSPEAKQQLAAAGITIRRARTADHHAVAALLDAHWPAWQQEVDSAMANDPSSLYLAFRGDNVVAFSAYDANNRGTGWFGPMGTAPEMRGMGIGRILLFHCLSDIADKGHKQATIPWVDPVGFYEQSIDAAVSRIFNRFEKDVNS